MDRKFALFALCLVAACGSGSGQPPATSILSGAPITPPSAPLVANSGLQYGGSYQSEKTNVAGVDFYSHLRFYKDGTVIGVSSTGTAEEICDWFNRETGKASIGRYAILDTGIEFVLASSDTPPVRVEHVGGFEDGKLSFNSQSLLNGHQTTKNFTFRACPGS